MAALLILSYEVTDPQRLAAYREAAAPALVGPGRGELVAATDATVDLPEGAPSGTHTVVLRFADARAARAAYDSPEYQSVVGDRLAATVPRTAMIVPDVS